ncbi:protein UPSTREAM OF FLC [Cinnamomum micranthum f. kanehirae]|uniref:Protein UPSTREAM OF FLC n=1 Tax=Cinnamomum micranthum f. kanehirae TaxID=337451 RepID=A0A3S3NYH6_9MAGN|nr:protein UPSTREAM OF FLC [Cinnamomum micranthum f. kanehirae]
MEISEEVPMLEKHLVKRKMESKRVEVRRLHIIYFLSRMGKVEHPHLIRVHHMNRSGVHLRDVKRWLSDLRGKDMPDSFSWSYKRQYKTGYVWQDLLDDDLITPIADNEYVLKGSEISAFPLADQCASAETATSIQKPDPVEDKTLQCTTVKNPEANSDSSCKPEESTKMEKAHSVKRRVTFKLEVEGGGGEDGKSVDAEPLNDDLKGVNIVTDSCFDAATPLGYDNGLKKDGRKGEKSQASSTSSFTSSKTRRSSAASQVFLNILKCGAVDAKESATVKVKVGRDRKATSTSDTAKRGKGEICKVVEGVGVCGSEWGFGGTWNQQKHPQIARNISFDWTKSCRKESAVADQKPVFGTCKPIAEPNCSQCGKHFKPEKLHTHMKSCRGMKSRGGKGGPAAEKMLRTTKDELTTTTKESSPESPLLTHCSLHQSY